MSNWTPKVGDKVMVGEHGPYRVEWVNRHGTSCDLRDDENRIIGVAILASVLTPAPEPEEPLAPGALVRDGDGNLFARDDAGRWVDLRCHRKFDDNSNWHWGHAWQSLSPRPITVILADPAEVETLRAEIESLTGLLATPMPSVERLEAERDRLVSALTQASTRAEQAEEAASHATVNADRFAAERDELRSELAEGKRLAEDATQLMLVREIERDRFAERIDEMERDYESAAYERDELQRALGELRSDFHLIRQIAEQHDAHEANNAPARGDDKP